jgi:hypothetical protein
MIMIIGGATIVGGLVLQQIVMAFANLFFIARGPQLQQTLFDGAYTLVGLIGDIAVPLGAAVLGAGIALELAARRPQPGRPQPGRPQPDHDRLD